MKGRMMARWTLVGCMLAMPAGAVAATYTVGPKGRQYTQLAEVFERNSLAPGDVVEVDGDAVYAGGIVVGADDSGSESAPVIIRWRRDGGARRPVLLGGRYHTIKFQQSNHVLFEGFEVTGGPNSCIFSEAHDVTVRDVIVRDCPGHGILGADRLSGSFTLEYSEIRNAGNGVGQHSIYMQSDEVAYPGSVFRMRFNYLHSPGGGNLVKIRHERSEIRYNWLEGATYQVLELIGPDCWEQSEGWETALKREDADVIGNVIVQSGRWPNAIRIGGDLNGRSEGRVRLVGNTIVFSRRGDANVVMAQLGAGSLEMHNNLIHQIGGGALKVLRENVVDDTPEPCGPRERDPWAGGRRVAGSYNWVVEGADVPAEWRHTSRGAQPGLADVARLQLQPVAGGGLAGVATPAAPAEFPYPLPLRMPRFEPPLRQKIEPGQEQARHDVERPVTGAFASREPAAMPGPVRGLTMRKYRKHSATPSPSLRVWSAAAGQR